MAEKSIPIGIDRMVITTPNVSMAPEELAQAATIRSIQNSVLKGMSSVSDDCILCYGGRTDIKSLGDRGSYVVDGIRDEITKRIERTTSREEIEQVLDKMVADGVVTQDWATKSMKVKETTKGQIEVGFGIINTKLPGYSEGNVTYAANAIYKFVKQATANEEAMDELLAQPIRYIYYATESNPDRSKPEVTTALQLVYSKLLAENEDRYLPIIRMMKTAQPVWITYACAGGGIALTQAVNSVRSDITSGKVSSALVITSDTAVYDSKRAPGAETTQGAASTLLWITENPKLAVVQNHNKFMHASFPDFTKWGMETPYVHGDFSEVTYVLMIAKTIEALEKEYNGKNFLGGVDFFISHVPFPAQAKKIAAAFFVHYTRMNNPALLEDIGKRIGSDKINKIGLEPLPPGFKKLTDLLDYKVYEFNRDPSKAAQKEAELVEYIKKDPDISKYWNWLMKEVRKQPEFEKSIERIHLNEALELPSWIGNSYTGSLFVSFGSMMKHANGPMTGALGYYGSGAFAQASVVNIVATPQVVKERLIISIDMKNQITHEQYIGLHNELIRGEAERHAKNGHDLIAKDMALLRLDKMPEGFYVRSRNIDGTGEYAYSDGETLTDLRIRH